MRSNLLLVILLAAVGVIAIALWVSGDSAEIIFFAPAYVFFTWAVIREVDPDHNWTALVAAAAAGGWVLIGGDRVSVLALGVLILVGRLVTGTTGRRPLLSDLVALLLAALIAFTGESWVVAFGLAIALYLDVGFSETSHRVQIWVSAGVAVAATLMATLTNAFPTMLPGVRPTVAIAAGALALILVVREPAEPITQVDARHKAFLRQDRLHASRTLVGMVVFAMSLVTGIDNGGLVPTLLALGLVVVSNEIELIRRRRI
ncbi:MAG TPA: hypothetical protein VE569_13045 [Acidimicrobiia bacterium]|nr:hypothetical protein [Acidimicrobiia bacterium]